MESGVGSELEVTDALWRKPSDTESSPSISSDSDADGKHRLEPDLSDSPSLQATPAVSQSTRKVRKEKRGRRRRFPAPQRRA